MKNDATICCPNCHSATFYIDADRADLIFFNLLQNGTMVLDDPEQALPVDVNTMEIHCSGCAWHGEYKELCPVNPA